MSFYHNVLPRLKFTRVSNAVAAGTTDVNCTGVDMRDFDGIAFVAAFGTLTATQVTLIKAQQSDDNGSTDGWSDIEGTASTAMADADSNKLLGLEIYKPLKRYVRLVIDRGTANAVIDGVLAIQYRGAVAPVATTAFAVAPEIFNSPAEGTA